MRRRFFSLSWLWLCLLGAGAHYSPAAVAEKYIYWDKVANAAFYYGEIDDHGDWAGVRTSSTWLLAPIHAKVKIIAIDKAGKPIKKVKIHSKANNGTVPPAVRAALKNPENGSQTAKKSTTTTEADDEDDYWLSPMSAGENVQATVSSSTVTIIAMRKYQTHAAVGVGLGREWLNASGGQTDFRGMANIGGSLVNADWSPSRFSPWSLNLHGEGHNFSVATSERVPQKYLRLNVRAGFLYDFVIGKPGLSDTVFGLGGGIAYLRLPFLLVTNAGDANSDGTASFSNSSTYGPYASAVFGHKLSINQSLAVELTYIPLTLGKIKTWDVALEPSWRIDLSSLVYGQFGLAMTRLDGSRTTACPTDSDGCRTRARTRASSVQAQFGIGAAW